MWLKTNPGRTFGGWGRVSDAYGVVDTKRGHDPDTCACAQAWFTFAGSRRLLLALSALSFGHLQSRFLVVMPLT